MGTPPADPAARARALIRLRAEISQQGPSPIVLPRARTKIRLGLAVLVAIALVGLFAGTLGLRKPAVAKELDQLAAANAAYTPQWHPNEVRIKEFHIEQGGGEVAGSASGNVYTGPGYTILVQTLITRTYKDGVVVQSKDVLSADFATPEDEKIWRSMGSPPKSEVGPQKTDTFRLPANWPAGVSTDPAVLETQLQDGTVLGYLPDGKQLFEAIGSLLTEPELNTDQRIALYKVVGSLDGVELLGEIQDPLERTGVGFSYTQESLHQVLIFDRDTGQPLAFEEYSRSDPDQIGMWLAFDP